MESTQNISEDGSSEEVKMFAQYMEFLALSRNGQIPVVSYFSINKEGTVFILSSWI